MAQDPILLRRKYIQNPPEGFTPDDIREMSLDELLDIFSLDLKCLNLCGAGDNPYFLKHSF